MGKQENFADLLTSQLEQIDLPLHYDFILPPLPLFLCVSKVFCHGFWYSRVEWHTGVWAKRASP
jgi:hypothetical protein